MNAQNRLRVSIVIPVYNEEARIAACLEAIAAQTVTPYEVIVVNNNSSDDTAHIAASYPFVTVITEKRQGVVYARNQGFDAAEGDIIGRIDADTVINPDWVEVIRREYESRGLRLALTGPCRFVNLPFSILTSRLHDLTYFGFSKLMLGHEVLFGSNMAISKSVWHEIRSTLCQNLAVHEDTDLSAHLPSDVLTIFCRDLQATVSLRMPLAPRPFYQYVGRWLYTLRHVKYHRLSPEHLSRN